MKKIFLIVLVSFLFSCGNESAENRPTDLDRTKNNDTSAVKQDSSNIIQNDSTDTTHL